MARLAARAQKTPDDPVLLEALGRACLRAKRIPAALTVLARAVQLEPDNAERLRRIAGIHLDIGQEVLAIDLFARAAAARSSDAEGWCALGDALLNAREPVRAEEAFARAASMAEALPRPRLGLARAALMQERLADAVRLAEEVIARDRKSAAAYLVRGTARLRLREVADAVLDLERCILLDPDAADAHHNLVAPLLSIGRLEDAARHGRRALELKDRSVCRGSRIWTPAPYRDTGVRVVSFSLWGEDRRYITGAIANAQAVPRFYPGWEAWFHVDEAMPREVLHELAGTGARIIPMRRTIATEGLFWRFLPASDPGVALMVARDCDSLPSWREAAAVRQWEESGRAMHVMRDHIAHCELVLAGMWGVRGGVIADIGALYRPYIGAGRPRWADQDFLAERVWPVLKDSAIIHDSAYPLFDALPFPEVEDPSVPGGHIGAKLDLTAA
ncbi:tetratricopeptide repeat protein [Indioceanicola profundi]|uniref:tetratricopeptide repeat protein n=1 Tax=Indioceanicola profundi TaxID=2220096 RepID=UPI000E6AD662|nr:tetratricopeptide repeat protein [Indioceanicola profundi]